MGIEANGSSQQGSLSLSTELNRTLPVTLCTRLPAGGVTKTSWISSFRPMGDTGARSTAFIYLPTSTKNYQRHEKGTRGKKVEEMMKKVPMAGLGIHRVSNYSVLRNSRFHTNTR